MDDSVARSMAKWPDVPDVYGWLSLDRRGNWLIRSTSATSSFERIGNAAFRDFISRNYARDARGCWYFQNGPQRVFVRLAYTPLVLHFDGDALLDHCGRAFVSEQAFLDEEGSVLMMGKPGVGVLDDRDLAVYEDRAKGLPEISSKAVPARFGFVANPSPREKS
jgi:hypothetical protein